MRFLNKLKFRSPIQLYFYPQNKSEKCLIVCETGQSGSTGHRQTSSTDAGCLHHTHCSSIVQSTIWPGTAQSPGCVPWQFYRGCIGRLLVRMVSYRRMHFMLLHSRSRTNDRTALSHLTRWHMWGNTKQHLSSSDIWTHLLLLLILR